MDKTLRFWDIEFGEELLCIDHPEIGIINSIILLDVEETPRQLIPEEFSRSIRINKSKYDIVVLASD